MAELKYQLYLDTSVLGALLDSDEPRRVSVTESTLERLRGTSFVVSISTLVIEELSRAPEGFRNTLMEAVRRLSPIVLEESAETLTLAQAYLDAGLVPEKFRDDARHLAIASVDGVDAVVSWNFRHMVNLARKRIVHAVNVRLGYRLIDVISPEEVPDA